MKYMERPSNNAPKNAGVLMLTDDRLNVDHELAAPTSCVVS